MKKLSIIVISFLLCMVFFFLMDRFPVFKEWDNKLYSYLLEAEYVLRKTPQAAKDIVIVAIDNQTVLNMPSRWPYPRRDFAKTIENIKTGKPRAIAIDFAYLGESTKEDDDALKKALDDPRIILAATINEYGYLDTSYAASLQAQASYGFVTKLQDTDSIIRRNLLYLVSKDKNASAFLSWEMQILKTIKNINIKSIEDHGQKITFHNAAGEHWSVPVDSLAKSFLIHFRIHTKDLALLSFYKVLNNDFDHNLLKDKIVLIGVLPALFGDSQNTSFGWMPGVILNANALLNLYTHDFLQKIPLWPQRIIIFLCVIAVGWVKARRTLIALQLCLFAILSYFLLTTGYVLDYISLPCTLVLSYFVFKKLPWFK